MDRAAKARQAKAQKQAAEYNARLQRMGLGANAGYNPEEVHGWTYYKEAVNPPELSHMREDIAEIYLDEVGGFVCGSRAYSPVSGATGQRTKAGYNQPVFRRASVPERKRFWPNAEEQHINYRARTIGGLV